MYFCLAVKFLSTRVLIIFYFKNLFSKYIFSYICIIVTNWCIWVYLSKIKRVHLTLVTFSLTLLYNVTNCLRFLSLLVRIFCCVGVIGITSACISLFLSLSHRRLWYTYITNVITHISACFRCELLKACSRLFACVLCGRRLGDCLWPVSSCRLWSLTLRRF